MKIFKNDKINVELIFRSGSLWVGAHWSPWNRRWCINLIPMITLKIELERKQYNINNNY